MAAAGPPLRKRKICGEVQRIDSKATVTELDREGQGHAWMIGTMDRVDYHLVQRTSSGPAIVKDETDIQATVLLLRSHRRHQRRAAASAVVVHLGHVIKADLAAYLIVDRPGLNSNNKHPVKWTVMRNPVSRTIPRTSMSTVNCGRMPRPALEAQQWRGRGRFPNCQDSATRVL